MWVLRETLRLAERVALAVVIAIVFAEVRTLVAGGNTMHTFRISLLVMGAVLLMMAGVGTGSSFDRYLTVTGRYWAQRSGVVSTHPEPGPVLTAGAVFVLSGVITVLLGLFV